MALSEQDRSCECGGGRSFPWAPPLPTHPAHNCQEPGFLSISTGARGRDREGRGQPLRLLVPLPPDLQSTQRPVQGEGETARPCCSPTGWLKYTRPPHWTGRTRMWRWPLWCSGNLGFDDRTRVYPASPLCQPLTSYFADTAYRLLSLWQLEGALEHTSHFTVSLVLRIKSRLPN